VRERGGAVADILIFIGAVVVASAIAGVACGACASGASPARAQSAPAVSARHRGDCRRHCEDRDRREKKTCFAFCDDTIIVPTPWSPTTTTTRDGERPR